MTSPVRRLAGIAGVSAIGFAIAIWLLAGRSHIDEPPDLISRRLASAVLLATPGLIGLIGAATRRRGVLVGAGVACLLQSAIAFSGVTLIYLIPAILFLRSAADGGGASSNEPIRPLRVALAALLAVPIALIVILNTGLLGVVFVALVAGVAFSLRRGGLAPGLIAGETARAAAIVLLVIGAWAATLILAETVCWIAHAAPGGGITWERIPETNTITGGPDVVSGGCAGGTITPTGAAVAGGLLLLAIGVAMLPDQRRRPIDGGHPTTPSVAGG